VAGAGQVVLLVLDGLGEEQLRERSALAPVLLSGAGGSITSVAPSTTACALTTLVTGRVPAEHGVVGYRVAVDGDVMNVLQWSLRGADARMTMPASTFQPFESFPGAPGTVPVVTRQDFGPTGFTAAHLGRVELHRWHTPAGLVTAVRELTAAGAPFVYAYYEGIDKVAHAEGLGQYYDDELRAVDRLVGDVLDALPPGAVLVVTADHGQVEVGGSVELIGPELMEATTLISGEGRFRWLHVRPGATEDVAATATALHGDVAWVRTKEQLIADNWLGGVPSAEVAARLGDVALVPFTPTAFLDPADTGELRLKARHGSLTPAEMLIPLLSWRVS
jgi:predicted AlkP superfamily pyrophosphatase or phosphodiesterase